MNVIITSAGRTCSQLARLLLAQNHVVSVVDDRQDVLALAHKELPTEIIFEGSPFDDATLLKAGIEKADVFIAGTDNDSQNLMLCYLAETHYHVKRKIARIKNPRHAWLFDKTFYVDYALDQAHLLAMMIEEEISTGHMMVLLKLSQGSFSLVKEVVPANAPAIGMSMKDINFECVIAAIIRNGEVIPPHGDTVFMENDEVIALVDRDGEMNLARIFNSLVETAEK